MSIVSKSDKGWELFYNIKNNKVNWTREVAWPESKFFTNQDLQHVNIPGPAAFFYSSGSYIFLFFASFTIFIIFFLVEGIINLIKKNFIFLSHFLIFNLAYRIIHIGLSQNNDLYFILSNILIILFLLMLNYFYKFK
jgi:hypothetical protein